jgi:hypothetical protein
MTGEHATDFVGFESDPELPSDIVPQIEMGLDSIDVMP